MRIESSFNYLVRVGGGGERESALFSIQEAISISTLRILIFSSFPLHELSHRIQNCPAKPNPSFPPLFHCPNCRIASKIAPHNWDLRNSNDFDPLLAFLIFRSFNFSSFPSLVDALPPGLPRKTCFV